MISSRAAADEDGGRLALATRCFSRCVTGRSNFRKCELVVVCPLTCFITWMWDSV